MSRYSRQREIQQLDPVNDNSRICHLLAGYEFPWDITRALEIALFRTFCVPSIAKLLDQTQEFHHRTQKRYDDTGLLVAEIMKWGHDRDRGRAAIERMNHIHGHFAISNDDFLYVLSTFIYEPIRWIDRFGWRKLTRHEQTACFHFWKTVGEQMHIRDVPPTLEAFETYSLSYERQHFRYSDASRRVGEATLKLFVSWFPPVLHPIARSCAPAILDAAMLDAFGFPHPPVALRRAVETVLQLRGRSLQLFPPRTTSDFFVDAPNRSYPQGYELTDLGPPRLLPLLNRSAENPSQD